MHKIVFFVFSILVILPIHSMEQDPTNLDRALRSAFESFHYKDGKRIERNEEELSRYLKGIENLLNFGANANALTKKDANSSEITPLEAALYWIQSSYPRLKVCELLFSNGANPNYNNSKAFTLACTKGDWNLFHLFLNHKANSHAIDHENKTMLHHAAEGGNISICESLLTSGLNLETQDKYGNTPLHYAAQHKHNTLCKFLLETGAKLNSYNNSKESPLELASNTPWQISIDYGPNAFSQSEKISSFKNSRQICQDMIIHQIIMNRNIHTLLGCFKKLGLQGNIVAHTLYTQRNTLLKPYLESRYCSLTQLLANQKPYKKLEEYQKNAYKTKDDKGQIIYARPIHEFQRKADEYCGFLSASSFKYTQNLSRPFFTDDWDNVTILPLHYEFINRNSVTLKSTQATRSANNNNNNNAPEFFTTPPITPITEQITHTTSVQPQANRNCSDTQHQPTPPDLNQYQLKPNSRVLQPYTVTRQPIQNTFPYSQQRPNPEQFNPTENRPNRFMLKATCAVALIVAAYLIYNWMSDEEEKTEQDERPQRNYIGPRQHVLSSNN